jgi:AraC-like DNA-binding protein
VIDKNGYERIAYNPFLPSVTKYENTGYSFSEHWHEHTEIHLILEGSCTLGCGDAEITLEAGDCAVLNGGELHRGCGGDCVFLCILLSPVFFGSTYAVLEHLIRKDPTVKELLPKLASLTPCGELSESLERNAHLYFLLSHLVRSYTKREVESTQYTNHLARLDKVNRAITYIHQNYEKRISTADLAKLTYLNESYFCQLFKSVMKQSAMEYLASVRLDRAEHLLRESALGISEIAFRCGFSDANYFSRTYKKHRGETPSTLRARIEKASGTSH